MTRRPFDQLETRLHTANPYWEYHIDRYLLPNQTEAEYHYVQTRGSVMIVPQRPDGRFVLVRQYRYLEQRYCLEFPGGGIAPQQTPEQAATCELHEETGYRADTWSTLGSFNPCKGILREQCTVFHATALVEERPEPEDSEDLHVVLMNAEQIRQAVLSGDIWDGMTLAAWSLCTLKAPAQ